MNNSCRNLPKSAALPPQYQRALELLLAGDCRATICRKCGISERTLRAWLADARFQTALAEAQGERLEGLKRQAMHGAGKALDVLKRIMNNSKTNPTARTQAAARFLEFVRHVTPGAAADVTVHTGDELRPIILMREVVPDGKPPEEPAGGESVVRPEYGNTAKEDLPDA